MHNPFDNGDFAGKLASAGIGLQPTQAGLVPIVIEQSNRGERSFDIFSRLLRERIVFVTGGMVAWTLCLPMLIGATIGGYSGAMLGRLLSPAVIRWWTLTVTAATTLIFFWRAYA